MVRRCHRVGADGFSKKFPLTGISSATCTLAVAEKTFNLGFSLLVALPQAKCSYFAVHHDWPTQVVQINATTAWEMGGKQSPRRFFTKLLSPCLENSNSTTVKVSGWQQLIGSSL
jgi:hypothetical protein